MPINHLLRRLLVLALTLAACASLRAANIPAPWEWTIDGVPRQALIYAPAQAKTNGTPVVFAFHGHGGNMEAAWNKFAIQNLWPQAIVVYMQGLNTPGTLIDREGKLPGWQHTAEGQGGRDLKFFDLVLTTLRQQYNVNDKRIYAMGHSNGGYFTYLLWSTRGNLLAAVAPASAAATPEMLAQFQPKPVLHIAGENDSLVKFAWQQETMTAIRKLNECGEGEPWHDVKFCTLYPSKQATPVVTFIHPGLHEYPAGASAAIVKFFKEHTLP